MRRKDELEEKEVDERTKDLDENKKVKDLQENGKKKKRGSG